MKREGGSSAGGREWFVSRPSLVTGRSSCELLSLPYPFSQVALMTPPEFATAAQERRITVGSGWRIDAAVLEALHRYRVLVPMYRVQLGKPDPARSMDVRDSLTA